MNDQRMVLDQRVRVMRMAAAMSWLGLIMLLAALSFLTTPAETNAWHILIFQTLPLLVFAPGLLAGSPRTHVWLCFVALLYFTQGVMMALQPSYRLWGVGEIVLAVSLFIDAFLYTRWSTDLQKLSNE